MFKLVVVIISIFIMIFVILIKRSIISDGPWLQAGRGSGGERGKDGQVRWMWRQTGRVAILLFQIIHSYLFLLAMQKN